MSAPANCLDCAAPLAPGQRYCSQCGQAADTHRISLAHFAHDLGHELLHADRNVITLTAALARRPGEVVREYLAGRRKRWFNPFAYLLLVAALGTLALQGISALTAPPREPAAPTHVAVDGNAVENASTRSADAIDSSGSARAIDTSGARPVDKRLSATQKQRARDVGDFMRKHQNLVMLLAVPFNALVFWIAFARRGPNVAEQLTANIFLVAFLMLFTSLLFYPLMALTRGSGAFFVVLAAMLLSHALYYAFAYIQWLALARWPQRLYALAVSAAAIGGWGALTSLAMRWYIAR
jgi:hypothetical protein